jgi:hypothetical protein
MRTRGWLLAWAFVALAYQPARADDLTFYRQQTADLYSKFSAILVKVQATKLTPQAAVSIDNELFTLLRFEHALSEQASTVNLSNQKSGLPEDKTLLLVVQACAAMDSEYFAISAYLSVDDLFSSR